MSQRSNKLRIERWSLNLGTWMCWLYFVGLFKATLHSYPFHSDLCVGSSCVWISSMGFYLGSNVEETLLEIWGKEETAVWVFIHFTSSLCSVYARFFLWQKKVTASVQCPSIDSFLYFQVLGTVSFFCPFRLKGSKATPLLLALGFCSFFPTPYPHLYK